MRKIHKSITAELSFLDSFEGLLGRLDAAEIDMVACTARQVWLQRNKWVFEGEFSSPVQLLQRASDQVEAIKAEAHNKHSEG